MKKVILVSIGVLTGILALSMLILSLFSSDNSVENEVFMGSAEKIGDHVVGDVKAPVKIYEYIDYQCVQCANLNVRLSNLVEEYDGKVALVVRTYVQNTHKNAEAAAMAAEAAGLQGFWQSYKDTLFLHQGEWAETDAATRQKLFEEYFVTVSDGEGDLERFREDIRSEIVENKLLFDKELGKSADLTYTPLIFVNNIRIRQDEMGSNLMKILREKIDFSLNL